MPGTAVDQLYAELIDQGFVVIPSALDDAVLGRLTRDLTDLAERRHAEILAGGIEWEEQGVILFNAGALWHSGTFNYSFEPRLAVTSKYTAA